MSRELYEGLTRFREDRFPRDEERYRRLVAEGQEPHTLFLACSDSRVLPDAITDTGAGELFVVRNVGNLVPSPGSDAGGYGVAAAVDFAVEILGVRNVVVCGHSHCGAIRALYEPAAAMPENLGRWLELASGARLEGDLTEELLRRTERRSVALQLRRLMDFRSVRERMEGEALALHGWHYVIEEGTVHVLDPETGEFAPHR